MAEEAKERMDDGEDAEMSYINIMEQEGLPDCYKGHTAVLEELLHVSRELGGSVEDNASICVAACRGIVAEVYSPPRVTRAAELLPRLNIDLGLALDLTTTHELGQPWDFSKQHMKEKARAKLIKQKPDLCLLEAQCAHCIQHGSI